MPLFSSAVVAMAGVFSDDGDEALEETGPSGEGTASSSAAERERVVQDALDKKQDNGNEEYAKGNYAAAVKAWGHSLQSVKYILEKGLYKNNEEQSKEVEAIQLRLFLNLCQGHLKTRNFTEAISFADKALEKSPGNTKALYRKASAYMETMSYSEAAKVLNELLRVEPGNAAGRKLLAEARHKEAIGAKKSKEMSKKMMAALGQGGSGSLYSSPISSESFSSQISSFALRLVEMLPGRVQELIFQILTTLFAMLEPLLKSLGLSSFTGSGPAEAFKED